MSRPDTPATAPVPCVKADIARRLRVALARVKAQLDGTTPEWDDEDALFRVGDVRASVEAVEGRKP